MKANAKRIELATKVLRQWDELELDLIVVPAFANPAQPSGIPERQQGVISNTSVFNCLNFAAGTAKVNEENEFDRRSLDGYPEEDALYRCVKEGTRGALGMPLNVQVVARPWQEELVMRILMELEEK